jgi:hypothetical protein
MRWFEDRARDDPTHSTGPQGPGVTKRTLPIAQVEDVDDA